MRETAAQRAARLVAEREREWRADKMLEEGIVRIRRAYVLYADQGRDRMKYACECALKILEDGES